MQPISTVRPSQLQQNLRLYLFTRIFAKRVFLPLSAVYFTSVGGMSIEQLGLLIAWFALVQVVAEVPTGYFADKHGKVLSIRIGALLNVCSTGMYVLAPNPLGITFGYTFEALGYSFFGGASEALLHDTVEAQGRRDAYTKIHSRIQAVSLGVNAVLVATVPLTYAINPKLPFIIGSCLYAIMFVVSFFLSEVYKQTGHTVPFYRRLSRGMLRKYRPAFSFFAILGLVSALYTAPSDFVNIHMKNLGLNPQYLGLIFGAGSVAGVGVGFVIHKLKALRLQHYVLLDGLICFVSLATVWTNKIPLIIAGFVIAMSFWRYRRIIYQAELLEIFPVREKATLISVINNAAQLNELYIPALIGFAAAGLGIDTIFGIMAVVVAGLLYPWQKAVAKLQRAK